jgi:folate-dependent phosphoribosylglycinamide formyltransferase PurN
MELRMADRQQEPEFIGVTVHHINAGIDTGDIIFQTKPALQRMMT